MIQKRIMTITTAVEPEMVAYFKTQIAAEWERYDKMGIQKIHFPPEEERAYLDAAYSAEWEDLEKKVPDLVPTLKKLTGNM